MSDLGSKIYDSVSSGKDLLSKLVGKIPGFSGYMERQDRRNSDKLLREIIADAFEKQWARISDLQTEFISQGDISVLDDLERAAIKLRTFADRVRTAPRGYSGFFDAVKVNEEELARLYAYDNSLLEMAAEVGSAIDHVQASAGSDGLMAAIRNLDGTAQRAIDAFNQREQVVVVS